MRSGKLEGAEYCFGTVSLPSGWRFPESRLAVQLVDPAAVYGEKHLLCSVYAHLKGFRLARNEGINLLMRITGEDRASEALKHTPKRKAVMIVIGKGAKREYAGLLKTLGAKESGKLASRKGELDAIEKTALAGL